MNNKGFTLIELLVVVLIIGILAAIALPQYTKAVERSRAAEAMQALGDLATAQSIFYMTNNSFAPKLSDLNAGDITVPNPSAAGRWYLGEAATTSAADPNVTFNVADDGKQVTMTMLRNGGMYAGAKLQIVVKDTGEIVKSCTNATTAGRCALVSAGGY